MHWGSVERYATGTLSLTMRRLSNPDRALSFRVIRNDKTQIWNLPTKQDYNSWKQKVQWNLDTYAFASPHGSWECPGWHEGGRGVEYERCSIHDGYCFLHSLTNYGPGGNQCAFSGLVGYMTMRMQVEYEYGWTVTAYYSKSDYRDTWDLIQNVTENTDWGECHSVVPPGHYQCAIDVYQKVGNECVFVNRVNDTGYEPPCYYPLGTLQYTTQGKLTGLQTTTSTQVYREPYELIKFEMNPAWDVTQWLNAKNFDYSIIPTTIVNITGYADRY